MGFMDSIFGGSETAANPYAGMGTMMPGAMTKYFNQMIRDLRGAQRSGRRERKRQFRLQRESFAAEEKGLQDLLSQLQGAPLVEPSIRSAFDKQLQARLGGMEMGAKGRGLYTSTIPSAIGGASSAAQELMFAQTFGLPRQQQITGLEGQLAAMPARRKQTMAAMRLKFPGYQMSGIPMLQLQRTRAMAQPWEAMRTPIEQYSPGIFGGAFQNLVGDFSSGFGASAGAGMMA